MQADGFYTQIAQRVVNHVINHLKDIGRLASDYSAQSSDSRLEPVFLTLLTDRMVGRDRELQEVCKAVRQKRHVAIVGDPGEGKSTLANEAGLQLWESRSCPAGVFRVDLQGKGSHLCTIDAIFGCHCELLTDIAWYSQTLLMADGRLLAHS